MTTRQAILSSLAYHDIFDYPMALDQIRKFSPKEFSIEKLKFELKNLTKSKKLTAKGGLYYLSGRGRIAKIRRQRELISGKKFKRARFYARILRSIPTINLVAVSGALAMDNADNKDDIDFVIVSAKNTIWTTRLLASLVLSPYRRRPNQPHTKDKACLNLFLDETGLKIGTHNLYTAHEVAQMRPIWQRQNTYHKFIKANSWIKNYLPNWQPYPPDSLVTYQQPKYLSLITLGTHGSVYHLSLAEKLTKVFQLRYMRRRITTEKIGDHQLFFHPGNTQEWVLATYKSRIKNLDRQWF